MNMNEWNKLDETARERMLARPAMAASAERSCTVAEIIADVRARGDVALRELTMALDGVELDDFAVSEEEFSQAESMMSDADKAAIRVAYQSLVKFHEATARQPLEVETVPGVVCQRVVRAIPRVGLYVPGGSAPLPSTALMLGVPAQLAGNAETVLCTPPGKDGRVPAAILYAAGICGITRVFKLGGAQAVAALAFGSGSIPKVDKIFGPGNSWVTEAKQQVAQDPAGAVADMPAGPSEVLVIADAAADPVAVAADLLSQAEHGPDSQVVLVVLAPKLNGELNRELANSVARELELQLATLPRAGIARRALEKSRSILVASREEALEVSNRYAPEHLIINTVDAEEWLPEISNAGSVFLGAYTPESLGDYCSGTNHVLPTYGYARVMGGLSVADFQKTFTVQRATPQGLADLGPVAMRLARVEGLEGHARAVSLRLEERTVLRDAGTTGGKA